MYYINFIFLYSFLGFVLESTYFKILNVNVHSSIFFGPYTLVYGFGMLLSYIIYNYLNLPLNILTIIIYYIIFTISTSLIEFIGGHIIHYFLHIDKWNYTNNKYHFGKYLCLRNCLIWGLLSTFIIFFIHPYLNNNILLTIPNYTTVIILIIFMIDLFYLILKQLITRNKSNNKL